MLEVEKVTGIGGYRKEVRKQGDEEDIIYQVVSSGSDGKAFLVARPKTIEVRCDAKLGQTLREKYESVMESRYFGRGGIEIVLSGQLSDEELEDLVRLSYNLTSEKEEHE